MNLELKRLIERSPFINEDYKDFLFHTIDEKPELEEKFFDLFSNSDKSWQKTWKDYVQKNKQITEKMLKGYNQLEYNEKQKLAQNLKKDIAMQEKRENDKIENILDNI